MKLKEKKVKNKRVKLKGKKTPNTRLTFCPLEKKEAPRVNSSSRKLN